MTLSKFKLILLAVFLPSLLLAQKEYSEDIPRKLRHYTLLIERIPLTYLIPELNERDSAAIAEEFSKIAYIQIELFRNGSILLDRLGLSRSF